jgi:hypothetical protein
MRSDSPGVLAIIAVIWTVIAVIIYFAFIQ